MSDAEEATQADVHPSRLSAARAGLVLFVGQAATSIIGGVGTLVLAAFLEPSDFGAVSAALLVIGTVQAALNLGFGSAVQALGPSETRDRTALSLALATGLVVTVATFAAAPLAMDLLAQPQSVTVLRVLAPVLILSHWTAVRKALVERSMRYGPVAVTAVFAAVAGVASGLVAVTRGAGVWALVVQVLVTEVVSAAGHLLIRHGPHRPGWDREGCRELWAFGRKLLRNSIYVFAYNNVDDAVVSRLGGAGALGLYSFAYRVANLPTRLFSHTSQRLMLPLLSSMRQRGEASGRFYLGQLRILSFTVGLFMFGILLHGDALLATAYGGRWGDAAATLRILALYGLFRSVGATTGAVFLSAGRPELVATIAKWQTIAMLVAIVPAFRIGGPAGAAAAVTTPLVGATVAALVIAAPMIGVHRLKASTAIAKGWVGALGANAIGWGARLALEGWGALFVGGSATLVGFAAIAAVWFRSEALLLFEATRPVGGGLVEATPDDPAAD